MTHAPDDGPVLVLATISLGGADVARFESYERIVLPVAQVRGAEVAFTVRAVDGSVEWHLLRFPTREALRAYREDDALMAGQAVLSRSGASVSALEVERRDYGLRQDLIRRGGPIGRLRDLWQRVSRPVASTNPDVRTLSRHMLRDIGLPEDRGLSERR